MVTSCCRLCASCTELSPRVYILPSERSNSVYLDGSTRTTRLTSTASRMAAARMAVEYTPLRNTLPLTGRFFLFFIVVPSPQFQRRFSSSCTVKNRNSTVTVR